jgi:hypothetical protein
MSDTPVSASQPPPPNSSVPAGWYPDPEQQGMLRFWDGAAWTSHRMPSAQAPAGGFQSQPPTPPPYADGASSPPAKPGMGYAWALACTPVLWLLLDVAVFQIDGSVDSPLSTLAGLAVMTTLVILDSKALAKADVHVSAWWGILFLPVYLVLRSKRAGSSWAVPLLWLVLAIGYGIAVSPVLNAVSAASSTAADSSASADAGQDPPADALVSYTCDDLSRDAVRISAKNKALVTLLKVREPRMVRDNRSTYVIPTGARESLVLACKGTGVWSDGDSTTNVRMQLTIDADGDSWVFYRPVW